MDLYYNRQGKYDQCVYKIVANIGRHQPPPPPPPPPRSPQGSYAYVQHEIVTIFRSNLDGGCMSLQLVQ
jgi:hypothetical protein